MPRATGPKPGKRASTVRSSGVADRCACSMAWRAWIAARMARALVLSPLAAWDERGHGCGASGGTAPSRDASRWRSMLWPEDVSGMVEKVMVCLLGRYTVIKEPVGVHGTHWLVYGHARGRKVGGHGRSRAQRVQPRCDPWAC